LPAAGTFEDLAALGTPQDDIDRQLVALDAKSAVEEEFAKLKAEAGSGDLSQATSNGDES
jgi:phage shock protein A